jgi:peptide/nickel transport system substrate-binding protein
MGNREDFGGLTRRDFLYLSGMGVAGLTLAGVPELGHGQEKKPKYGGNLRLCKRWIPAGIDAHKNQEFADYESYCFFYGALTEQGPVPNLEIYPMLAKSWEISGDGREYTFPLREGVKFHHGKEFDSADVKYSLDRVMNPATRAPRAYSFKWVDSISIIDKYHLKIKLKEPFAPFLEGLTLYNCPIIPNGWEPTGMKPAPGTGPFKFKSFLPNETIEFTRNDQYYEVDEKTGDRLPYLDSIYMKKIVDETVRWTALRAGDMDIISGAPLKVVADAVLKAPVPGIVVDWANPGVLWIWFNCSKPPFDNKKVRQAIAYGVDKKEILKAVFWGLGDTLNNQAFEKGSRFYIPMQDREVDLPKAKQLLAEAGYPNGFKTEFFGFSSAYDIAGAQVVIGELKKIGIEATLKVIDRVPYHVGMRKGDYSISFRGAHSEVYGWDDAYYMYLHSSEIGINNYSRYSNKEVDALLEKGRTTMKWEDRRQFYKKALEILREDLPIHYFFKPVVGYAYRDYVKGFRKGFSTRGAWYRGGAKYWWLDK